MCRNQLEDKGVREYYFTTTWSSPSDIMIITKSFYVHVYSSRNV